MLEANGFTYNSQAQLLEADSLVEYYAVDRAGNKKPIKTLDLGNVPMSDVAFTIKEMGASHLSGEVVRIEWSCEDPSGMVDHFEVLVDGVVVKTLDRDASSLDLETLVDGGHSITVRAVGDGGNSTYQEVVLTVGDRPPGNDLSRLLVPAVVGFGAVGAVIGLLFWRSRRSR
jgi:hypothetical protein